MLNKFAFISVTSNGIKVGQRYLSVNTIDDVIDKSIKVVVILIVMFLVIKIGSRIINAFVKRQSESNLKFSLDEKKSKTLGAILKSILKYTVYFFGITGILTIIIGNISLTFAGIGGVAIGFGAQSIIKDMINGLFILFEDQYAVGDYINIDDKSGIVEAIELRVTKIRDFNGDLHIVPNGTIGRITNHSRGNARILIQVNIEYKQDIDKAIEVMNETCDIFSNENENIVEKPKVSGVSAIGEKGITLKVYGKVKPMTQWEIENQLRREIKLALDRENIKIYQVGMSYL